MGEGPTAEAPGKVVGRAAFWYDEAEFVAVYRASRIAANRFHDTRAVRAGLIFLGHYCLLASLANIPSTLMNDGLPAGPRIAAVFVLFGFVAIGAWIVYRWLYDHRHWMRRRFRGFPLADTRVFVTFTRGRLITRSRRSDASLDWAVFWNFVELHDGFLLMQSSGAAVWIPKHALDPTFDAEAAGSFLKSKIARSRRIGRYARLPE